MWNCCCLCLLAWPWHRGCCLCWQDTRLRFCFCWQDTRLRFCLCWPDHQTRVVACVDQTTKPGLLFVLTRPPNQGCCLCWPDHQTRVVVCVDQTTKTRVVVCVDQTTKTRVVVCVDVTTKTRVVVCVDVTTRSVICVDMTTTSGLLLFVLTGPDWSYLCLWWPPNWGCCLCWHGHQIGNVVICVGNVVSINKTTPKWDCSCLCQHDHQNGVFGVCVNMATKMGCLVFVSTWPPKWGCWCLCQHDHQNGVVGVCVNMTTKMGLLVLSRTTKLGLLGFALMAIKSGFLLFVLTGPSGQGYCLCWDDHWTHVLFAMAGRIHQLCWSKWAQLCATYRQWLMQRSRAAPTAHPLATTW